MSPTSNSLLNHLFLITLVFVFTSCASRTKIVLRPIHNSTPPITAGVYELSQVTEAPTKAPRTRQTDPQYPSEFQNASINGKSVILLTVTKNGNVTHPMILDAADVRFGDAALEAVRTWKYRPASLNGKKVNCRISVPVTFRILN